jgi:lipopolysaccharide export LptBFGC system permease protein LptF
MRGIIAGIRNNFEIDRSSSVLQVQKLALDFRNVKFDTTKLDSSALKQNVLMIQSLMNRFKGYLAKLVSQKQVIRSNQKQIDSFLVEIYKKYSIPFACVIFVLIGAPLGMRTRKGGFGIAAGMSLGFFLLYWACLIGGEKLADRELLSPFLSMWIANIILGSAGLFLVLRDSLNIKKLFKLN